MGVDASLLFKATNGKKSIHVEKDTRRKYFPDQSGEELSDCLYVVTDEKIPNLKMVETHVDYEFETERHEIAIGENSISVARGWDDIEYSIRGLKKAFTYSEYKELFKKFREENNCPEVSLENYCFTLYDDKFSSSLGVSLDGFTAEEQYEFAHELLLKIGMDYAYFYEQKELLSSDWDDFEEKAIYEIQSVFDLPLAFQESLGIKVEPIAIEIPSELKKALAFSTFSLNGDVTYIYKRVDTYIEEGKLAAYTKLGKKFLYLDKSIEDESINAKLLNPQVFKEFSQSLTNELYEHEFKKWLEENDYKKLSAFGLKQNIGIKGDVVHYFKMEL